MAQGKKSAKPRGGYIAGDKKVSDLKPPPPGPGVGSKPKPASARRKKTA